MTLLRRALVGSLALAASALLTACGGPTDPQVEVTGPTMGTYYAVKVARPPAGLDAQTLQAGVELVLKGVIDALSTYDPESELSCLNRNPSTVSGITRGDQGLSGFQTSRRELRPPLRRFLLGLLARLRLRLRTPLGIPPGQRLRRGAQFGLPPLGEHEVGIDRVADHRLGLGLCDEVGEPELQPGRTRERMMPSSGTRGT